MQTSIRNWDERNASDPQYSILSVTTRQSKLHNYCYKWSWICSRRKWYRLNRDKAIIFPHQMHFTFSLTNKPKLKLQPKKNRNKEKNKITKQTSNFKFNCRVDRVYYYEIGFVFEFEFGWNRPRRRTPSLSLPETPKRGRWWGESFEHSIPP